MDKHGQNHPQTGAEPARDTQQAPPVPPGQNRPGGWHENTKMPAAVTHQLRARRLPEQPPPANSRNRSRRTLLWRPDLCASCRVFCVHVPASRNEGGTPENRLPLGRRFANMDVLGASSGPTTTSLPLLAAKAAGFSTTRARTGSCGKGGSTTGTEQRQAENSRCFWPFGQYMYAIGWVARF